jgi:hypothetical protein
MHDYTTIAGHITIVVVYVLGQFFAWLREGRRHRWQQEQFRGLSRDIRQGPQANGK